MADEVKMMRVISCDALNCDVEYVAEEGHPVYDFALGFHGEVTWHHASGGTSARWYACKEAHIKAAVIGALRETYRDPD